MSKTWTAVSLKMYKKKLPHHLCLHKNVGMFKKVHMYKVTTTSVFKKISPICFLISHTSEKLSFIDKNNFISKKFVWCACAVMCNVLWCSSSCLYICLWHKYYFCQKMISWPHFFRQNVVQITLREIIF